MTITSGTRQYKNNIVAHEDQVHARRSSPSTEDCSQQCYSIADVSGRAREAAVERRGTGSYDNAFKHVIRSSESPPQPPVIRRAMWMTLNV